VPAGGEQARIALPPIMPKNLYLVTEDWFLVLHFLPIAQAARDCGLHVVVATPVRADGARLKVEGFSVIAIASRQFQPVAQPDRFFSDFRAIGHADMIIPYHVSNGGKSLYRRSVSNVYAGIVNLISGFRLHYHNGLAVHLRYNVMRWHPNTRGFGLQADIICMLLDQSFSYKEVPVISIERRVQGSNALTFKIGLSVSHTLIDLIFRRLANLVYRRR
jgi:hypothetical protein